MCKFRRALSNTHYAGEECCYSVLERVRDRLSVSTGCDVGEKGRGEGDTYESTSPWSESNASPLYIASGILLRRAMLVAAVSV